MSTNAGPAPPVLPRRLFVDARPLRESSEYRRLWIGGVISSVGSQMTAVAVPVQIYGLTHSSLAVGLVGLAVAIPLVTMGLVGGTVADAADRRTLVLATSGALTLVSLGLAAQAVLHLRLLWPLYALVALQSGLVAIDAPARRTFVPRLLPPQRIAAAAALSLLSFHVSLIAGPLLAGVLIARAGFPAVYLVEAASALVALYAVWRLRPMPQEADATSPGLAAVVEGLHFVRRHPVLSTVLLADLVGTVFGMPRALFPALVESRFGGGPQAIGLLYAAPAIGGLLAAIVSGRLTHVRKQGLAVLLSIGLWGAAITCFGIVPWLWPAALLLATAGAADVVTGVFRTTILQINTPDAFQGRVSSVGFVVGVGGPQLGDVEAGLVATPTSPTFSAVSGGAACVVGIALLALAVPAFRRYRPEERDAAMVARAVPPA